MREVIRRQFFECHHRIVSDPALGLPFLFRDAGQHMGQEAIVRRPELQQIRPSRVLISLYAHAASLIVSRPAQLILKLGANEALVVVGRRIDQVTENLLARPTAFGDGNGGINFANSIKIAFAAYNQFFQAGTQLNHGCLMMLTPSIR